MLTKRMAAVGVAALAIVIIAACSSTSASSSPNKVAGQCVLSNGVWYCGDGYGNYPDCPATTGPCTSAPDAGFCFSCLYNDVAGAACSCLDADGGGKSWQCEATGTGCGQ
jgi:hypothetical protein